MHRFQFALITECIKMLSVTNVITLNAS